ncbi:ATP-binding cassette sub-family C member 4-like [Chrysoperla carnea]|uniref:ATP-binding cassette sub-family C member 4-like n=1 Tax=Chrysoperla carnea TaxID=189513 RepID=UPI001D064ABC|nr:ATP-binding cassette sub-family C member 4-like [Chrysoperla carnea]
MNSVTYAGKSHPKPSANIISRLTFGWLVKLFYKGYRKTLELRDIYETQDHNKSEVVGDKLEANWKLELIKSEKNPKYEPSLLKALIKTFYCSMILEFIFVLIIECVFRVLSPFILGKLLIYFNEIDPETNSMSTNVYYTAGFLLLNSTLNAFFVNHSNKQRVLLGMRFRIACCSLLYRKILRLNQSALSQTSVGQITNLLSNDVNRFDMLFAFIYYFPIVPFQVALITYLLWESVNYAAFAGVLLLALQTIPVQGYVGKISAKLRLRIANLTDSRVVLMNEIVSGIQVLKMYAWEKPFEEFVRLARLKEVNIIRIASYIKGLNSASMVFTERTTIFVAAVTFTYMGNVITADKAFAMAQYFNILQCTLALYYPTAILLGAEVMVSIRRLETFFLLEEQEITKADSTTKIPTKGETKTGEINIKNMTASWIKGSPILHNITTKIRPGELCAIIGPVGSGKSSLLNTILSEIIPNDGTINVNGVVSYSCQEPWLFVGSVRNNILFGLPYDRRKYQKVVQACSLKQDFIQFPYGDRTVIGDKGASLSGGQKARINLARAVYRSADIYLLDDPLSAVDTHVGKHLFQECIETFLHGTTRILVTHQIQHLQKVNHIIVMQNGKIEAEGSYAELMSQKLEFIKYLDNADEENEESKKEEEERIIPKFTRQNTEYAIGRPSSVIENMPMSEEEMESGTLDTQLYFDYFRAGGNICQRLILILILILSQVICSANDYWLSYWTSLEQKRYDDFNPKIVDVNGTILPSDLSDTKYNYDYDDSSFGLLSTNEAVYIYASLIALVILATSVRSVYFYRICMNASINLHNTMFNKLLQAPMRFFDKNPIGRILNRFSKDTGAVDELLPKALIDSTQIFSVMVGILVLISVVNPILLIPTAILLISFIKIRTVFISTAQDLKRLEGIARSPVFSHSSSTLSGLTTIRACNAQDALQTEFDLHQDLHTSTWYLFVVTGVALGLWVDLLCVLFLAVVMFSFIIAGNLIFSASNMGLALSQCMILINMVQYGIKQSVEVVCQMTSVERMLQYTKLETEGPFETSKDKTLRNTWPEKGDLRFDKLYMKYDENEPAILKNLNLNIKPTEKVGIVGRTGAGKSSLISSLFHLSIIDGDIIIDGINIKDVGLQDLRSRISIIPQQPVLFSASMRFNLDPFNLYTDGALWEALEEVELKDSVPSLDFKIQSGGTNFSIGQRQLICLARAILKQNKILVLDEATANVDPQTDGFIQETIREKFANCTVLTIAHRLNTIMDSDKVLVMDTGEMAEYDHPYKLLQNKKGIFYSLVEQTGVSMSEHLYNVAKESFMKKFGLPVEENTSPDFVGYPDDTSSTISTDDNYTNENPTTHL